MNELAIEVRDLRKAYGKRRAVDGVTLAVPRGQVLGLIGRNGAGKTTLVECLEGLREPDGGHVRVLGLDPRRDERALRRRLGVQLQHAALPERLRVHEAVTQFAAYGPGTSDVESLLDAWGLADHRFAAFGELSGGLRQRLFLVLALLHDPELLVLDELGAGLDAAARRATWQLVRRLRDGARTILLVSHDLHEVRALCDRVVVLDAGRVVADGPPEALALVGGDDLEEAFLTLTVGGA